jgi:hypothetical protein
MENTREGNKMVGTFTKKSEEWMNRKKSPNAQISIYIISTFIFYISNFT